MSVAVDILDILKSKKIDPTVFNYDNLWIPTIDRYLLPQDIETIREVIYSIRLSAKMDEKYKIIDSVMNSKNFVKFAGGTNRVIYRYLEDQSFVAKIAIDRIGVEANRLEYQNQEFIKPYCAKTFHVTQCGTIAFSERLQPVLNKEEFRTIARDVYRMLMTGIIGKYVADDIGSNFFLNFGIRTGFGVCLVDYPYIYPLDEDHLYCTKILETGQICNGEIDYDDGLNFLICSKCKKRYYARDLMKKDSSVFMKRKGVLSNMKINIKKGDKIVKSSIRASDTIVSPEAIKKTKNIDPNSTLRIQIKKGDTVIKDSKIGDLSDIYSDQKESTIKISVEGTSITNINKEEEQQDESFVETNVEEIDNSEEKVEVMSSEDVTIIPPNEDQDNHYSIQQSPRTNRSQIIRDQNGRILMPSVQSSFMMP